MKRIKFIYNPISGSGNSAKILDTVIATYQKYNKIIVPFRIGETFPLEKALEDIHDNYEHLLIAGGDGTINRVLNLYMKKELTLPIAILPTGTANDFAKYLDIPLDIAEACEKILHSKAKRVDLGKVNDVYFINVFSFGLFTDVSQKTPTHLKNTFGKLAYYFNGMKEIPRFGKIDLKVESEDLTIQTKCFLAFVFNGQTAGNINIAYNSKINDGLLDVILVKGENLLKLGNLAYNFLRGEHLEKAEQENILYFKSKSLSLSSSQEITTDIDGETGPSLPVQIKCIPKAFPILY
ncbi:lipid kinase [Fusobacterium necrophorum subsp. funduliforme]|uniref:YegS/Rv2252/BmrU family lipid kinase n=1 Tax=Fusobacterium necrophorum TaxID=859 RepID=UPI000245DF78|nr:YegS/Rv2252/BmrU family lipid kinase [Fusobacterium necrophorum]AVQ20893.1 lipid kinase [Fusobacterium necrophorum subsp. funduliforme]EHO21471.1 YegS//BmrU family lipid kinase [Fusobacterium necrophorum subsp. funduliforme 1_1_36S]